MQVLFLYRRLFLTAQKQLQSLKRLNFGQLEDLTRDRDAITRELCDLIRRRGEGRPPSGAIRTKIRDLIAETVNVDTQIKELLVEELKERTVELSGLATSPND